MSDFVPTQPVVYRYGVLRSARDEDGEWAPLPLPAEVREQLMLYRQVRNDMVEAERRRDGDVDAAWRAYPPTAVLAVAVDTAAEAVRAVEDRISSERVTDRSAETRPASAADLTAARQALTDAYAALRQTRKTTRAAITRARKDGVVLDPDTATLVAAFAEADRSRDETLAGLYPRYCQNGGVPPLWCVGCDRRLDPDDTGCGHCATPRENVTLYWATFNAARADHRVAVGLVVKARGEGRPAELTYRRWDGTGVIAVQLQRMHGAGRCWCWKCRERAVAAEAAAAKREQRQPNPIPPPDRARPPKDPRRTPARLAERTGHRWASVFTLSPWVPPEEHQRLPHTQRVTTRGLARLNVGRDRVVGLPVTLHRMMPADADVAEAQLSVWRPEGPALDPDAPVDWASTRAALCVTVLVPVPAAPSGPTVAVHTGWRKRPDGSVRVGVWRSTEPLTLPGHVQRREERVEPRRWQRRKAGEPDRPTKHEPRVVATVDGTSGEILMPAGWLDRAGMPAGIRSHRDLLLNRVRADLLGWLESRDPDPDLPTPAMVRAWRSPHRLRQLARRWLATPPAGAGDVVSRLSGWTTAQWRAAADGLDTPPDPAAGPTPVLDTAAVVELVLLWEYRERHLHRYEAGERDQLGGRRTDAWRVVAAALTNVAGRLLVDDVDLTATRRRPDRADTDPALPAVAARAARFRAALTAPGILRQALTNAARTRGVPVDKVDVAWWTRTCPRCHEVGDDPHRYAASAVVACPYCGQEYDQDHAVAGYMLSPPSRERPGKGTGKRDRSRRA